jgi:uncharacterized protein YbaR (Trm112 family)
MIPQDLLEILRCPHCVTGDTRRPGNDPGQLELVKENWLVCREPDCGRKYPVVDDIPVMMIAAGERWIATPEADLPSKPPADAIP